MADTNKPHLTEDELIERKVKIRKMISNIFIVVALISVIVLIVMLVMTRGNVNKQTTLDTQELRSKLKNIINLELRYKLENGVFVPIKFLALCKELPTYDPAVTGTFKYQFDEKTGIATGMEKDPASDVNGDSDGNDGLTLSLKWEADVVKGTGGANFFWPDEDKAEFQQKAGTIAK